MYRTSSSSSSGEDEEPSPLLLGRAAARWAPPAPAEVHQNVAHHPFHKLVAPLIKVRRQGAARARGDAGARVRRIGAAPRPVPAPRDIARAVGLRGGFAGRSRARAGQELCSSLLRMHRVQKQAIRPLQHRRLRRMEARASRGPR